jgi:hypothetical protein
MKNKMTDISAIILVAENADKTLLDKCLESVSWCDEVLKIETASISGGFSEWRNFGANKAKSRWLLYVDTDEEVSENLKNLILESVATDKFAAYAIPRRNFIWNQEMKHCGLYPDYVLRLINKSKLIGWYGELHEQPKINGPVGHLKEPFIHRKHNNLSEMVAKTNKWSEIEAKLMFDAHHPPMNFIRFFTAGFREFWKRIVVQMAFLDGSKGLVYGLYQVFSKLVSYSKLWEMQFKSQQS